MPAAKGTRPPNAGKGRVAGSKNKVSSDIKAMILTALDKKGGAKYLERQAEENPVAFMGLLGKVLPTQVTGDENNPLRMINELVIRGVRADDTRN